MRKLILLVFMFSFAGVNAQNWSTVGKGMNVNQIYSGSVYAFDTLDGNLYVGGTFDSAGGGPANCIAEWNGANWAPLGSGLNIISSYRYGVFTMTVYNGNLYVGGGFDSAGGSPANQIAEWNGIKWMPLGNALNRGSIVNSLTVYNGELYAGGYFDSAGGSPANCIARWNGTKWLPVGSGMNNSVLALIVFNGDLYAGGSFDTAGGVPAKNIAVWNGSKWMPVGSGMSIGGYVDAMSIFNGNLYVGGLFDSAGGIAAINIAEWNGTVWNGLGSIINGNCCVPPDVEALTVFNGNLYAGGAFDSVGGILVNTIAEWNGTKWDSLQNGMSGGWAEGGGFGGLTYTRALMGYKGSLYAGGAFSFAGPTTVYNIAKWGMVSGINELSNLNIEKIFPNPSNSIFTMQSNKVEINSIVEIYNMLGEKIYTAKLNPTLTQIDLSNNADGIYLYRVLTENGDLISAGKMVIQK
jgi:hypothetical protein